ncbi:hypothetical protein D3C77_616400 [compost metagenome]
MEKVDIVDQRLAVESRGQPVQIAASLVPQQLDNGRINAFEIEIVLRNERFEAI